MRVISTIDGTGHVRDEAWTSIYGFNSGILNALSEISTCFLVM